MTRYRVLVLIVATVALAVSAWTFPATASVSTSLRRYPYLTDLVKRDVTVNWATTTSVASGTVRWGKVGGPRGCDARTTAASNTTIAVGSTTEHQWKASLTGMHKGGSYCYRVLGDGIDLLGTDPTPTFHAQLGKGTSESYSFAVFGDWGEVDSGGNNADQADLMDVIAASDARFAVTTGDTAYPDGSQLNYGDLVQEGSGRSAIFGPDFWTDAGATIPLFNAQGNHGLNNVPLVNWPQDRAVSSSGGRYRMDTYCCFNGTRSESYPSSWYAFNAGPARIYVLEAAWSNSNVGSADLYKNDYDAHWTSSRAEYQWLLDDLQQHPAAVSFAFVHFPLWVDNATETSDPWLHGSGHLEELLGDHGVDIVFSGHAHLYERNAASAPGMPVTYVSGGGGGRLEPVSGCTPIDQYAIGWSYSSSTHGSACGAATRPTAIDQVFHFLLVHVDGTTVTVTPTDEQGRTFDVQTYEFG
jgi:predicted phosphodiesterase